MDMYISVMSQISSGQRGDELSVICGKVTDGIKETAVHVDEDERYSTLHPKCFAPELGKNLI